jgi:hypothetical protein
MKWLALAAVAALGCGAVSVPAADGGSVGAAGDSGGGTDPGGAGSGGAADAAGGDGPIAPPPGRDGATTVDAPGRGEDAAIECNGQTCTFAHGVGACLAGACTLASCQPGFGDCNGNTGDGCEAPLTTAEHCGSCASPCGPSGLCVVTGSAAQCTTPASAIDHLRWEVPCGAVSTDGQLCDDLPRGATTCPPYPADNRPVDRTVTFGGQPGTVYQVTVRLRGVVEPHAYTGGTRSGAHFQIGGAPTASGYDVFSLAISSPAATFYVNADDAESRRVLLLDDQPTLAIEGGATVRIQVADADCKQVRNCMDVTQPSCQPVVIPGFPPSNGQFVQLDVVSVKLP